jgi:hypothetical protein
MQALQPAGIEQSPIKNIERRLNQVEPEFRPNRF